MIHASEKGSENRKENTMKKLLSTILAAAMVLSLFSVALAEETVTLRFSWWGGDSRHEATLAAIARYEELNPHVKIEAEYQGYDGYNEKILTQLSGGTQPDMFQIIGTISADYYASFPDRIARLDEQELFDLTGFEKAFLDSFCVSNEGYIVSVPTGINSYNFILNKTVEEKTGVEVPDSWTWEEFIEVGKEMHEADPNCYLITLSDDPANHLLRSYVRQMTGLWTISEDNTVITDRDALVTAFTWLQALYTEGVCEPVESSRAYSEITTNKKLLNNEVAMIYGGSSAIANIDTSNGMQLDFANIPMIPGAEKTGVITQPAQCMMISNNENTEETLKFANWFFNDPEAALILKDSRGVPAVDSVRNLLAAEGLLNPILANAVSAALEVTDGPVYVLNENAEVYSFLFPLMEQLCYLAITPEEAADMLIEELPLIVEGLV